MDLQSRVDRGYRAGQLADLLELLAEDRAQPGFSRDSVDLVWTGPEAGGVANRDTGVVVRELFYSATQSVMIAGYAVYQGQQIFLPLAQRMEELPHLRVRMYLDVRRPDGDTSSEAEIVRRFVARFKERDWPGNRLPEIYYDPRSTELDPFRRACLHAKCVVVDEAVAFVSSANFTEAAQLRNIEVGLLVRSPSLARHLVQRFEIMTANNILRPVPGSH